MADDITLSPKSIRKIEADRAFRDGHSAERVGSSSGTIGGTINNFQTPSQPTSTEQSLKAIRTRIKDYSTAIEKLHPSHDLGSASVADSQQSTLGKPYLVALATKTLAKAA